MKRLIGLIVVLFLVSCSLQQKQLKDKNKLDALSLQYPSEAARLANWLYPCFTGKSKSDTVINTVHDTTQVPGSPIFIKGQDGKPDTVKIPGKVIHITTIKSIHDTVTNDREIAYLKVQLTVSNDSLKTVKEDLKLKSKESTSKNKYIWILIGLGVLGLLIIVWKVYSSIYGGVAIKAGSSIISKL